MIKAFTLLELLVVISIIGLLASLVTGMSGLASRKMRDYRVQTELQKLITAIENYKLQVGYYPPDNPTIYGAQNSTNWQRLGRNALLYELSGCIFSNTGPSDATFRILTKSETVTPTQLKTTLGAEGVVNSARRLRDVPFRQFSFKSSEYKEIKDSGGVSILAVPVEGLLSEMLVDVNSKTTINPWRYDSSSTNRHNPGGFDISAKYMVGRTNKEVGNWKN